MMDQHTILKQYFGHDTFRDGQEEIIGAILAGRDCIGIMPTGGGKSLCYQIPALMLTGITLVISPLISLMQDQVAALRQSGVAAAYLNSTLQYEEASDVFYSLRSGHCKILYVAPERLHTDGFLSLCRDLPLSLIAVDEAHCISQWGQDFRPSYLQIVEFLDYLPQRPVVCALTATATARVREDIAQILALYDPFCVTTGFDRPNLYFDVQRPANRMAHLRKLIAQRPNKSGIVYCATRAAVEQVCDDLIRNGVAATRYHAGLSDEERFQNQEDFQFDRCNICVATNAFGMGIDKSNVSFVIHYQMPKSIEAYYQEAGRAGRDGERADCILLYSAADIYTAKALLQNNSNELLSEQEREEVYQRDLQRLNAMIDYCTTNHCYRNKLLSYFGQERSENCGNCGNCCEQFLTRDITVPAQMILSCIKRVHDRLGYYVGIGLIIDTLRGSRSERVIALGLDRLSTYALMKETRRSDVQAILSELIEQEYLYVEMEHKTLRLTKKSSAVLFGGARVEMREREPPKEKVKKEREHPITGSDDALTEELRKLRNRMAQEIGQPPYVIFSNATLSDMALRRPTSIDEFLAIHGIGKRKAEQYAAPFLKAIAEFECRALEEKARAEEARIKEAQAEEAQQSRPPIPGTDEALMEELRQLRDRITRETKIPPFNDKTLSEMAARRPTSVGEFLAIHGIGKKKAEQYGALFIKAIEKFKLETM